MKATKPLKQMIVAGLMSGTSADGADVALVRVTARAPTRRTRRGPKAHPGSTSPKLHLLGFASFPYPRRLGQAVLAAMDAQSISTAELARLHWRLGQFYGDSIRQAQEQLGYRAVLVGVHGQTMYHQGQPAKYLGTPLRCTWQIGEASEVAARTQLPVVSDFRPADMVAGGQAAPLVSIFDRIYFAHPKRNRVLQNLGGIANMSAIPAGSHDMIAFDSGPASVIMDACMKALFKRPYDRGGATARRGKPLQQVLDRLLQLPYFKALPPKSCGREEFGGDFVVRFIEQCRALNATSPDVVATATAFTAETISHVRLALPRSACSVGAWNRLHRCWRGSQQHSAYDDAARGT